MAQALTEGATHMIGLARPLTAEPRLCADLVSGKAAGAKPNRVNEQMTTFAAMLQMNAVSEGKPIPDFSDEKVARETEEYMTKAMSKPAEERVDEAEGAYKEKRMG
jgi:hypothetical protein